MPDAPFIGVQDLADRLGRDVTTDPGAISAVDSACAICRTISEQSFNAGTATIALDGTNTDALLLPQRPVTAVTNVVIASQAWNAGTITDYTFKPQGVLLRGTAGGFPRPVWPAGRQNVVVTYSYGYASMQVPADVCEVALSLASRLAVQGVAKQETVGDVVFQYGLNATDLTDNELRILRRYRGARSF